MTPSFFFCFSGFAMSFAFATQAWTSKKPGSSKWPSQSIASSKDGSAMLGG